MKSVLKNSAIALALVLLSSSCATTFYSADSKTSAQKHRSVAIMPSSVTILPKGVNRKVMTEVLQRQENIEALNFQLAIYAWMLKSKSDGKISIEIQDIDATNAKLKSAGYPETLLSDAKLCEILGVDGIVVSTFQLSKPMSSGDAAALSAATGVYLTSDEVRGTIGLNDCADKKLIWSFEQKMSGNDARAIVSQLMKKAGKKMPYVK
jgi:hypothetical protein